MFWGWLSVPLLLILALVSGTLSSCAKIAGLCGRLLSDVSDDIPTLNRRKRERLHELRIVAVSILVGLLYVGGLGYGMMLPSKMVSRVEPLRPPVAGPLFAQRWQNPECPACGGEDLDMKDSEKIAPTFIAPHWKIGGKVSPLPWYLMERPVYQ
jgi:hypothetical protein